MPNRLLAGPTEPVEWNKYSLGQRRPMNQEDKEIIGPKSVNGSRRLDAANKFFNNKLRK
jgi:hypothetical protein